METSRITGFEELKVYKKSRDLVKRLYAVSRTGSFSHDFALRDQIIRGSISIYANIAEGSERGSATEFIQFLYISKGSCAEVRAHLNLAHDLSYLDSNTYQDLAKECRNISGMLANLIAYLRKTPYRGYKFK